MKDASVMRTVWEIILSAIKLQCSVMELVKEAVAQRIIDMKVTIFLTYIHSELLIVCLEYIVMALVAKNGKRR
jgi:hypothetical protein